MVLSILMQLLLLWKLLILLINTNEYTLAFQKKYIKISYNEGDLYFWWDLFDLMVWNDSAKHIYRISQFNSQGNKTENVDRWFLTQCILVDMLGHTRRQIISSLPGANGILCRLITSKIDMWELQSNQSLSIRKENEIIKKNIRCQVTPGI